MSLYPTLQQWRIYSFCEVTVQLSPSCLTVEVSRSHTTRHTHTHTPQDFSECVISSSNRPLSTQHKQTYIHTYRISMPLVEFEPDISAIKRLQNYAFDGRAAGFGSFALSPRGLVMHCEHRRASLNSQVRVNISPLRCMLFGMVLLFPKM
jgi:hypothetical protein